MDVPHDLHMKPRPDTTLDRALDAAFMARVFKTSLFVSSLVALFSSFWTIGGSWAFAFLGASVWSTANLWTLERLVRGALRPGPVDKLALAGALLIKLPLLYAALVAFILLGNSPASAVLAGVSVPLAVIVLKVLGRLLALRLRASGPGLPEPRS